MRLTGAVLFLLVLPLNVGSPGEPEINNVLKLQHMDQSAPRVGSLSLCDLILSAFGGLSINALEFLV